MQGIAFVPIELLQSVLVVRLSVAVEVVVVAHHKEELIHGIEDVLFAAEELHEFRVLVGSAVIGQVAHDSHEVQLAATRQVLESLRNLHLVASAPVVAYVRVGDNGKGESCLLAYGDEQRMEVLAANREDGCAGILAVVLRDGQRQRLVCKAGLAPVGIGADGGALLVSLYLNGMCCSVEGQRNDAVFYLVGCERSSAWSSQRADKVVLSLHPCGCKEEEEENMSFHFD